MAARQIPFKAAARDVRREVPAQRDARGNEFCRCLDNLGIAYRFQGGFYHPFVRIADFYLPHRNLIIEIDCAGHDPEEDQVKDEWFKRVRGIRDLRLTNEQVFSGDFELPCAIGVR